MSFRSPSHDRLQFPSASHLDLRPKLQPALGGGVARAAELEIWTRLEPDLGFAQLSQAGRVTWKHYLDLLLGMDDGW